MKRVTIPLVVPTGDDARALGQKAKRGVNATRRGVAKFLHRLGSRLEPKAAK